MCLEAGYSCFAKCKVATMGKPGWSAELRDLRDDSLIWHELWLDSGQASGRCGGVSR